MEKGGRRGGIRSKKKKGGDEKRERKSCRGKREREKVSLRKTDELSQGRWEGEKKDGMK